MIPVQPEFAVAPIDSARVVSEVYSISLLATAPFAVAAVAAIALRRAPAGTRALVWRTAVVALLTMFAGQLLPARWEAWIIPAGLAAPLIEVGRLQVAAGAPGIAGADGLALVRLLSAVYCAGLLVALIPLLRGALAARTLVAKARIVDDPALLALRDRCLADLGIRRRVELRLSRSTPVPLTVGIVRPVVVLPVESLGWPEEHRRAALLHELAHVAVGDVGFRMAAHVAAALFWFHPCAWWVSRRLRAECELASDDRVLAAGVRPSAYGTLLLRAADAVRVGPSGHAALALAGDGSLRGRLAAVVQEGRDLRAPGQRRTTVTLATGFSLALALGLIELAPTRDVLRGLMRDTRWESRAFAVLGLAPRPDSIAVARAAAASDPEPLVRAWASYALASGDAERPHLIPINRD